MRETSRRVLMVSTHGYVSAQPELGKPDTGGQVVYVLEMSKCLARMGYAVDIVTRKFEDQSAVEQVQEGVRVLRFPCGGGEFIPKEQLCDSIPEWTDNALGWIERRLDDVVLVNSHYWDAGLAGIELSRQLGVCHVHTPHSLGVWKRDSMPGSAEEKERRYNFCRRIAEERNIYDEAARLVATTTQQRDLLEGDEYQVAGAKIDVIPPGFEDTRFFPVSTATRQVIKRRLGLEGKIVLAVGRLARNKGYDLLIRAMLPVLKRAPTARLVLAVGRDHATRDERMQLQELKRLAVELGIADQILFHDHIADGQLADYYRAADVFALSSRYEPFGMTAVEAMACGTPTVMTTEGGLWEQVTWGVEALYANPNDTDSFGHALCRVLLYPEIAAQLAENGARKARSCFTWTAVTQKLLSSVMDAGEPAPLIPPAIDRSVWAPVA